MSDELTPEQLRAEILARLPDDLKEAFLEDEANKQRQMVRGAIAQVFHRNFSHNLGPNLSNVQD